MSDRFIRQGVIDISPGGDNVQEGFESVDSELNYVYTDLNLLATDVSTITSTKQKQPARQSIMSATTLPNGTFGFITNTNLNYNLIAPLNVTFANGFDTDGYRVDLVSKISNDVTNAWVLPNTEATYYLYVDRDINTSAITYGYTTIKPVYGDVPLTITNKHWYSPKLGKMFVWDGSTWQQKHRVFLASVYIAKTATLVYSIDNSVDTTLVTVSDGSIFPTGSVATIDSEQMYVMQNVAGVLTVARGYNSTALAPHTAGAIVHSSAYANILTYTEYPDEGRIYEKLNKTDPAIGVGTKKVDETNIADGLALTYNTTSGNIEYRTPVSSVPGIENYIANGLVPSTPSGTIINMSAGTAYISEARVNFSAGQVQSPGTRKTGLIYATKTGSFGAIQSKNPLNFMDNSVVATWIFNQTGAGASIPNSAVGLSTSAVANSLTASGGLTSVDGWFDYSITGNGTSGYYLSANSTGIPAGTSAREIVALITAGPVGAQRNIVNYGNTTNYIVCNISASGNFYLYANSTGYDTGYPAIEGETYLVVLRYDGTNLDYYVNGKCILTVTVALVAIASTVTIAKNLNTGLGNYFNGTLHFIEIRNAVRSADVHANMSNQYIIPCFYTDQSGTRKDIRELLPADSIALGFYREGSSALVTLSQDYKYGRREKPYRGNRTKFLGWKSFASAGSPYVTWTNPFGNANISSRYVYADNVSGMNELPVWDFLYYNGTTTYGMGRAPSAGDPLNVRIYPGGLTWINGTYKTTGYIGCYATSEE